MFTYLLLNIITLLCPVSLSFDRKVYFFRKWPVALLALSPASLFFIIWDVVFTRMGVWEFNPDYLVGLKWLHLPLEEWLFFLTVPFANIFIYEVLVTYWKREAMPKAGKTAAGVLALVLLFLGLFHLDKLYTSFTFLLTSGWLLLNFFVMRPKYLGMFFIAYLIHLIPFAIVNGILTAYPVVIYNNAENLGLRIGSIPVEDSIYSLLLYLMCINLYEYLRGSVKP